jgi:hypothetical protein
MHPVRKSAIEELNDQKEHHLKPDWLELELEQMPIDRLM